MSYTKEDVGATVYLPEFGKLPCKIEDFDITYSGDKRVKVMDPDGKFHQWFDADGHRGNVLLPTLSRTPWTERAVTERPWEPEVGEFAITQTGRVVKVFRIHNGLAFYSLVGRKAGFISKCPLSDLRPFTPEAAYELLGEQPKTATQPTQRPLKVGDRVKANEAAMAYMRKEWHAGISSYESVVKAIDDKGDARIFFGGTDWYFDVNTGGMVSVEIPNARVTLIEDQPADDQPFGPEDVAKGTIVYDDKGEKWVAAEWDGEDTNYPIYFHKVAKMSKGTWAKADGQSATDFHCFTRHNPLK